MSILLVDDSRITLRLLSTLLAERSNETVRVAASGAEALSLITAHSPFLPAPFDVIVTDIGMPQIDGVELCGRLKADPHVGDVPVLIVTGMGDERTLERAFAAGAHDFITKPISPTDFLVRVNAALRFKREMDKRRRHESELLAVTRELERVNKVLERLSTSDELTGIANRRSFAAVLDREWRRAVRNRAILSLGMIDVDHFKSYNDFYGHLAGDRCLVHLAETLCAQMRRPGDFLARYGGEEFVFLLPNTDVSGAQLVAEKLRSTITGLSLEHARSECGRVSVSIGVASALPARSMNPSNLLAVADEALYRAKADGRNRVVACAKTWPWPERISGLEGHVPLLQPDMSAAASVSSDRLTASSPRPRLR